MARIARAAAGENAAAVVSFIALVAIASAASAAPDDPAEGGAWGAVIDWPLIAVSAANLPDGRVLTWSGSERETWPTTEQTYSTTWDPQSGVFTEVFHAGHNMFCAHLAMLEDGRVFVNGGRNQVNSPWTSLFDYRNNEWQQIENMQSGGRWYPTSLALADGDVFTAIGTATLQQYPERWDPDTGWQIQNGIDFNDMVLTDYYTSDSHGESRWWPLLHVAPNGQIFHSGPTPDMHYIDPSGNGSYQQVGQPFTAWYHKHGTSIMYAAGKILTAGGWISGNNGSSTNQAFTVDLNGPSPVIALTDPMLFARKFHNGVVLPNGEVLVVGGNTSGAKFSDNGAVLAAEIWSPDTGNWREAASMTIPRNYHSVALLLTDGRVLSAGSGYCSTSVICNGASHKDGQVYSPPYLFDGVGNAAARPAITAAPGRVTSGAQFAVTASPGMDRFTMIKMSSTTHGVNTDVRFVEVDFSEDAPGSYTLTAHPNQNVLTPGYWMLFALDMQGAPSPAQVVQANTTGLPWIRMIADQADSMATPVSLQVVASDADNDPLTLTATGLPPGITIDSQSGLISGASEIQGSYSVTVTASDNDEGSRSRSFNWQIVGAGVGQIRRDWWTGVAGTAITDLTGLAGYPNAPTGSELLESFAAPVNWAEDYGTRIHGYLVPPVSGDYVFWIASDDNGELWLSSDDDEANKVQIAHVPGWSNAEQWTKFTEQQSATITLQSGQRYFIEALQKEGGGGDNLAVAWQQPGASGPVVIAGAYLSEFPQPPDPPANILTGVAQGLSDQWKTIYLTESFADPVVIATPRYSSGDLPAVTRIRNVQVDRFEIRVQNPSGVGLTGRSAFYLVVDPGTYENSALTMEVGKVNSSVTDHAASWVGQPHSLLRSFANPVVLGQVQTANDDDWSVFWARGPGVDEPPSGASLYLGKHVGEDADTTRANETLGYVVFEAGSGLLDGFEFSTAVGSDTVTGMDDTVVSYPVAHEPTTVLLAAAGMDGANGGWPVLRDPAALQPAEFALAIDEDQLTDAERTHTAEQVAWLALSGDISVPVEVQPIVTTPGVAGDEITWQIEANVEYLLYKWNFGDGTPETVYADFTSISHTFNGPGRYVVVLTILDPNTGEETTETFVQLIHAPLTAGLPAVSASIAVHPGRTQVWKVNPDNDSVTVIDTLANALLAEITMPAEPRSVAIGGDGRVYVTSREAAVLSVIDADMQMVIASYPLPRGSLPYGIAFIPGSNRALVALEGSGELIEFDADSGTLAAPLYLGPDVRHVSIDAAATQALVSRFVTPPLPGEDSAAPTVNAGNTWYGGQVVPVNLVSGNPQPEIVLRHSSRGVSEHTGPGVPNYLGPAVISPDGLSAWVPSKQDNILAGALRGGQGLTFDQTVRAITSKIDLVAGAEQFSGRIDHDNAGVGSHAAFGPYGAHLFVALETNREIVICDAYSATEMLRFDTERAPQGVAMSGDGSTLYVDNFMDRSVTVYDVSDVVHKGGLSVVPLATITTVQNERLAADVFLGKQLFYDARDTRLAGDSYMSCASCHNAGGQDGRVWDFTGLGEGLRNTITLNGRGGTAHGFLHWSANFDEIQDFEGQIRGFAGGTGLMSDADFETGNRSHPLGDSKAGLSADLDALAAYLTSLRDYPLSPHRAADGMLTPLAQTGRAKFAEFACGDCHAGTRFTDSGAVTLHDVGTQKTSSGQRLAGPLTGLDAPSLLSVWRTPPYLHDGSAFDLSEAIDAHAGIRLRWADLEALTAYLEQLDPQTMELDGFYVPALPGDEIEPVTPAPDPGGALTPAGNGQPRSPRAGPLSPIAPAGSSDNGRGRRP